MEEKPKQETGNIKFLKSEILFQKGGFKSVLKWAFVLMLTIFILQLFGAAILFLNPILMLVFLFIFPNIALIIIYYFALKEANARFGLKTYYARLNYILSILVLIIIFYVLIVLVLTGEWEFPDFGIAFFIITFLMPYLIKENS